MQGAYLCKVRLEENERYSALGTVVIQRIPKSTNSPSLNIYSAKERKGEPSLQVQVACYTTTNNDMSYRSPLPAVWNGTAKVCRRAVAPPHPGSRGDR